jgi:hypothetical protein
VKIPRELFVKSSLGPSKTLKKGKYINLSLKTLKRENI